MTSKLKQLCTFTLILFLAACKNGVDEIKFFPVKSGKDFEYIDREGKIIINPQFSEASVFRNGLALVQTSVENPKWGFIGEDGKYVINAAYKSATVFSDDLAWVISENAAPTAIDNKGAVKITLQDAESVKIFKEGLAAYSVIDSTGVKWGFVNKEGKVTINPQFTYVGNFNNGNCAVANKEGKWGYIDKKGTLTINYQFDRAKEFANGKAVVFLSGKAGVIDEKGKYTINPQFSDMRNDGEAFLVEQDGKWGWSDRDGKIIINPQFSAAHPFLGFSLAAVQSGENWGFIDKEGKIAINPQFDMAFPFNGNLAMVVSAHKAGFIDKTGKYIINPQFEDISRDLLAYLLDGSSIYESVQTDFFNLNGIVSKINTATPEGLSFSDPISQILTKLKKTENDLNSSSSEHLFISNKKITNDATYNFYVIANAFTMEDRNGFLSKTLNATSKANGFAYTINLSGKGNGKEKEVKEAIEKTFSGYTKDESLSNEVFHTYKNDKQAILTNISGNQIIIIIVSYTNNENAPYYIESIFNNSVSRSLPEENYEEMGD